MTAKSSKTKTQYVIGHASGGRLELLRDPLNGREVLAFEECGLAAFVATLLERSGFVAARLSVALTACPVRHSI